MLTAGPKYLQICTPSPSPVSQMRQDGLDPVGQWRREVDALARRRMDEGQPGRVKGNAAQALDQLAGNRVAALAPAIGHVSDQGMAEGSEVDTDLMGTPRLETALEVGHPAETLENLEARDGALARARTSHRHADPGARVARDRSVDHALGPLHDSVSEAEIAARHGPPAELRGEGIVGHARLGEDDQTRGALVESMNDAWAPRAAHARDLWRVRERGGGQGARRLPRPWMRHHACGLVHHEDVGVFEDDSQR